MRRTRSIYRRRWARRGRGVADFVFGFAVAGLAHLLFGLYKLGSWACERARTGFRRRRTLKRAREGVARPREMRRVDAGEEAPPIGAFSPHTQVPVVHFNDVAGLDEAKREIMLRMVLPVQYQDQARALGVRRGGGLLLYGPPGTGKTLLAKAVASELDCPFYHVRPSDIMSGQVGEAERNVQRLFQMVRANRRAVLFLDEVESLVPSRRRNGSTIMARVISQFLSEVDGLDGKSGESVLLLIGATNEPGMIDPAMLRPGRFDTKVYVGPPDREARRRILQAELASRPMAEDVDVDRLAEATDGMTGAEIKNWVGRAVDKAFLACLRMGGMHMSLRQADFETLRREPARPGE
jgi:transitional endoplasmic reticulum ATPase